MPDARTLHRREAVLLQRVALVRCASWGLQRTADFRVAHARAPLRWLSLGRRRRTRAVCTRAPCRAGCGRPMPYASTLPRREASLLRRAVVVRRASCGLQHTADFCVAHTGAPLRWLSLGSRRSTRACCTRVPCCTGVIYPNPMQRRRIGKRPLSLSAPPWYDVPAAASNAQPTFASHMRTRRCAGCLSGGGAARELAARARHAAMAVVGLCYMQGHRTGERPLSFGARPWCDVPAAASEGQPAFAWHARARVRHCDGCLSGGGAARELSARARRAALAVSSPCYMQKHYTGERPLSFGARP